MISRFFSIFSAAARLAIDISYTPADITKACLYRLLSHSLAMMFSQHSTRDFPSDDADFRD